VQKNKFYTVNEATKILEYFCAYQERCHKEVENKLTELRMIPEAKEQIILHLLENNFLNEERFAKAFVRGKFNFKKWGKIKIKNELKFRNISSYNIKVSLKEIDDDLYQETIQEVAQKKVNLIRDPNSFKKKQKLIKYLLSKGYESEFVYKIANELIE